LEEAGELLDDLINKNQKMFFVSVVIVHFADSLELLKRDTNTLNNIARKYVCSLGILNYQQEEALKSVLPLGKNYLKISRTLTTESTAILLPFNIQELIQEQGMYYGKNAISKNLLIFNRLALKNPNGFILGTPGSGKSFTAKREMINVLLNTNDDVIIIDPEREYTKLAKNLGGEVIEISAGSGNYLNPLDMTENYSDNENPLCLKSEFIMSLCACLLGGSTATITAAEKTIIDRSLKKTYEKYFNSGFNKKYIPTLNDFQNVLESQNERAAKDLAVALELYTRGSLSVFSNKTNVNVDNRFVIYDTKDLGKQLKTMGLLIVLDNIWNRITENRQKGKRTWIYIDEIYLLFTTDYSANFLFELYKRARKWGGIPTGITQNVEDLLGNDLAKSMLANSDFLMMMNQAPTDRIHLANLLNISEAQLTYITNSNEGEGLLFSGNAIIPFEDKFPKNTELYRIMTTKVDEIAEYKKENFKEIIV
jgi:type IV secretory pathway VirB4 component